MHWCTNLPGRFWLISAVEHANCRDYSFSRLMANNLKTSSSAVAERPRNASCLSVVSFSSTIPRASSIFLRQRMRYMFLAVFVCLSVCLLARLLKNAWMDLDEILRVDTCRDMDELINFWARSGLQSRCRNRIAFSDIVYALLRGILRRKNPTYTYWPL